MADERTPLMNGDQTRTGCKLHVLLISLLTGWPWNIVAFISGNKAVATLNPRGISCLQWLYVILRMFIIILALFTEVISCFRQDRLDSSSSAGSMHTAGIGNNDTEMPPVASSNGPHFQIFVDVMILDSVIIALLFYVLLAGLALYNSTDVYDINQLINATNDDIQPEKSSRMVFLLIPLGYMILSIGVSGLYLYVYFKHTHVMWPEYWEITGSLKTSVIIILLAGTFATDLLYIQIILRYAFRCQLNIHFLQLIISKVENETYRDQDEAIKDVERSRKFVKQLNTSSRVTGFTILLALIQATNSAINLLHDFDKTSNSQQLEEVALICRLLLWIAITIAPFYHATKVNETSETLSDTRLVMLKIPALFRNNTALHNEMIKKNLEKITIKAKLFGIPIPPWSIYVAVILILLGFALRSVFELYKHLIWY